MFKPLTVALALTLCGGVLLAAPGCKTGDDGVKSTYRSQYKTYNMDVETATAKVEDVLNALNLKEVKSSATKVDGQASAKTADGTKITVSIARVTDSTSEVSVYAGTLGDPKLGGDILAALDKETDQ